MGNTLILRQASLPIKTKHNSPEYTRLAPTVLSKNDGHIFTTLVSLRSKYNSLNTAKLAKILHNEFIKYHSSLPLFLIIFRTTFSRYSVTDASGRPFSDFSIASIASVTTSDGKDSNFFLINSLISDITPPLPA